MSHVSKIRKFWLDWNRPVLPQAADWLIEQNRQGRFLDLSDFVVALPSAAALRRLRELIVLKAQDASLILSPPEIVTVGDLPEYLYSSERPFASKFEQIAAWIEALQRGSVKDLKPLLGPSPSRAGSLDWLPLAKSIQSLHRELSSEVFTFRQVVKQLETVEGFVESERWHALAAIQRSYFDLLESQGLWDKQTARTVAVFNHECHCEKQIVLVGNVDLNRSMKRMLQQVAENVDVLIAGDKADPSAFDEVGCLHAAYWLDREFVVPKEQISIADSPREQAKAVTDWLREHGPKYAIDEIQLGVPDAQIKPYLTAVLDRHKIAWRDLAGQSLVRNGLFELLSLLAGYVDRFEFEDFAKLIRHRDLYQWLCKQTDSQDWLEKFDRFRVETLPARFKPNPESVVIKKMGLQDVCRSLHDWLAAFFAEKKSIQQWAIVIRSLVLKVYQGTGFDRTRESDRRMIAAINAVQSAILELESASADWLFKLDGSSAIRLLLEILSDSTVVDPVSPDTIELAGWLELRLSDSQAVLVTGMNDGIVPSVEPTTPYLPGSLRSQLQLVDNRRRLARDAYAIEALCRGKQQVHFVMGRRDAENSPLMPSRLLMNSPLAELSARSLDFFQHQCHGTGPSLLQGKRSFSESQTLEIPKPKLPWPQHQKLRVTDFKSYLECPYRFYLSRVLGLKSVDDVSNEFAANQFGNYLHQIVEAFGKSDVKDSSDFKTIRDFVLNELESQSGRDLGQHKQVAVSIQLKQLALRLEAFARVQAQRRLAGWMIHSVELKAFQGNIQVDGKATAIEGRIDRIDVHENGNQIAVLDYKAFDKFKTPDGTHRKKTGEWTDLQLPLYYHMLLHGNESTQSIVNGNPLIQVGYFVIPGEIDKTDVAIASWTEAEYSEAFDLAISIIRSIQAQVFWPPVEAPPQFDPFPWICQRNVFEPWTIKPGQDSGTGADHA